MSNDFQKPEFIKNCDPQVYKKWLTRKANTHLKRDKKRWETSSTPEEYKIAIHRAVIESKGVDAYTGKMLRWDMIGQYDNDKSKEGRSEYKKKFGDLPTVDHVSGKDEKLKFKICSWTVNDAKNDLNYKEFVKLCREVIEFEVKNK